MNIHSLLVLLADGEIHSGSELGALLGISRAAIWKKLSNLEVLGLSVESVKGKGYRLPGGLDLLDSVVLQGFLPPSIQALSVVELALDVESTNQVLLSRDIDNDVPYQFLFAEMQRSGRGRRGRSWVSPFGKNLYMSVAFELGGGVDVLNGLSLVMGVACVRALREVGFSDARLKWPNDVWVGDRKLAGILVELRGEATTGWSVVAGIGLNVYMSDKDAADIEQPWISLSELSECSRTRLAAALVQHVVGVLEVFRKSGFASFIDEWMENDALRNRKVDVSGVSISGVAKGVDLTGALCVETDAGITPINAGEVSVRPA